MLAFSYADCLLGGFDIVIDQICCFYFIRFVTFNKLSMLQRGVKDTHTKRVCLQFGGMCEDFGKSSKGHCFELLKSVLQSPNASTKS